jgi:hypothetical protein
MADEINVQNAVTMRKISGSDVLLEKRYSRSFQADMTGKKGPTPGALTVDENGVNVSLSQLTEPGMCWIEHQGLLSGTATTSDRVNVGIYETNTNKFYPLLELLPGEAYPVRLSRDLGEEIQTGTGTDAVGNATLHLRAPNGNDCVVSVEAYEA